MNPLTKPALLIRETSFRRGTYQIVLIGLDGSGKELWRRHGKEVRRACAKLRGTPLKERRIT